MEMSCKYYTDSGLVGPMNVASVLIVKLFHGSLFKLLGHVQAVFNEAVLKFIRKFE